MRRTCWIVAILALFGSMGCHRDKYNLSAKYDEEYVLPPDEARFNNPPESGYKKPSRKRETDIRNTPGGGGMGFGRGGGGGAGGGLNGQ